MERVLDYIFLEMIQNINCKDEPSVENAIYTRGAVAGPSELRRQRVPLRQSRQDDHLEETEAGFALRTSLSNSFLHQYERCGTLTAHPLIL